MRAVRAHDDSQLFAPIPNIMLFPPVDGNLEVVSHRTAECFIFIIASPDDRYKEIRFGAIAVTLRNSRKDLITVSFYRRIVAFLS